MNPKSQLKNGPCGGHCVQAKLLAINRRQGSHSEGDSYLIDRRKRKKRLRGRGGGGGDMSGRPAESKTNREN